MSMTYDDDLDKFERQITELQESPTDAAKRYAVCQQSRFMLDAVEQAMNGHDGFINEARRSRVLSLLDLAILVLENQEDEFFDFVLVRASLVNRTLATHGKRQHP